MSISILCWLIFNQRQCKHGRSIHDVSRRFLNRSSAFALWPLNKCHIKKVNLHCRISNCYFFVMVVGGNFPFLLKMLSHIEECHMNIVFKSFPYGHTANNPNLTLHKTVVSLKKKKKNLPLSMTSTNFCNFCVA